MMINYCPAAVGCFYNKFEKVMEKYSPVLKACPLFAEIAEAELRELLDCLGAARRVFGKNRFIFREGDAPQCLGVVLGGRVQIVQMDYGGQRSLLAQLTAGELFGEAFVCAQSPKLPLSVVAAEKSEILLINYQRALGACPRACRAHACLIKNMLRVLADKNIALTQKVKHVTRRGARAKLLSYLQAQARQAGTPVFAIPFNRQELADYLVMDRSAMCNELSKMRRENILRCQRNHFELLGANRGQS
jgi:CRP-like cAMP-binding protein